MHDQKLLRTNARIDWLDLVRSLAIIMVITVHAAENIYSFDAGTMNSITGISKLFAFCAFTFGRLGVPLFLFLTGYLLLDRRYDCAADVLAFWKKKLLPLLITFECWTLLYELFCVWYYELDFQPELCLKRMLFLEPSYLSHMWYMPMILGLYLTLPLLSCVLRRFPLKVLLIPMAVCFLYCFILSDVNVVLSVRELPKLTGQLSLEFTGGVYGLYAVCGYVLKRVQPRLS
ncbi:MAG: acyltransferase, partial [Hominenteromicrobium sp.]